MTRAITTPAALTNTFPLGETIRQRHGVPYFLMHRGDLHAMLVDLVPADRISLNHKLAGVDQAANGTVRLSFTNGETAQADAVIGADGVHSVVREFMLGKEQPRYTGRVAYRTVFPTARLSGLQLYPCVKWWGPDRHIVSYFVNPRRDELYFVTSTPEPEFSVESWSAKGDLATLRAAYDTFHPQVRAILAACPDVHKWALVERDPLPTWVDGNVALLGDACHPMTPYMAQGASTSIEDAASCPAASTASTVTDCTRHCVVTRHAQAAHCADSADIGAEHLVAGSRTMRTGCMATMRGAFRWPMTARPHRGLIDIISTFRHYR